MVSKNRTKSQLTDARVWKGYTIFHLFQKKLNVIFAAFDATITAQTFIYKNILLRLK
jgi:hypothetical protein